MGGCNKNDGVEEVTINFSGSSSVSPLMQKLAADYESKNAGVTITITTSDSGTGVSDTLADKNDVGMASRDLKSTETGLTAVKICDDGIAVIVHKNSALTNVTAVQLYDLYKDGTAIGDITDAISREAASGTRDAFDSLIKKDGTELKKATAFSGKVSEQNSTSGVKTQIAASPNRIGYISLGSLDDTVKAVKFEDVAASAATVKNGTYKLARPFNILLKEGKTVPAAVQKFIDFIKSEDGQKIVEAQGYIKL
jgi:phosphate transport system substrate-binding protein